MGPVLDALTKLQSVENTLRAAKAKLSRCRRNVIIKENQLRALQSSLEAKKEEMQLTQIQIDRLELELKSRDETLAKYRTALNSAKNNKEYAAILTELNTNKADSSKIENQSLELLRNIDIDQASCQEVKDQIEQQKEELNGLRKESDVQSQKFEAEIAEIKKDWEQATDGIPEDALKTFKRVADTYDGEVIAEVEIHDARMGGYTCGGCFMGLTNETANLLMTKDEVIRCPNCARILIIKQMED